MEIGCTDFLQAGCPSCHITDIVKTVKEIQRTDSRQGKSTTGISSSTTALRRKGHCSLYVGCPIPMHHNYYCNKTDTHLMTSFARQPGQAGTRKVKPIWILMKQEMMGWQWHQPDHMPIICTSLQTDNHASTLSLNFLKAGCSSWRPTNSVRALKAITTATVRWMNSIEDPRRLDISWDEMKVAGEDRDEWCCHLTQYDEAR